MKTILSFFVATILLFSAAVWSADGAPININTATAEQLADSLNGIGLKKAQAIVAYREQVGGFKVLDELTAVKGVGPAILEKNRSMIVLQ
jgi:competence protein ComEA